MREAHHSLCISGYCRDFRISRWLRPFLDFALHLAQEWNVKLTHFSCTYQEGLYPLKSNRVYRLSHRHLSQLVQMADSLTPTDLYFFRDPTRSYPETIIGLSAATAGVYGGYKHLYLESSQRQVITQSDAFRLARVLIQADQVVDNRYALVTNDAAEHRALVGILL